jgi:dihydrodipicolinate synthase/N-acetylneuraminate lyase
VNVRQHLLSGQVIPAHPLALTPARTLDERAQRALTRYYLAAGAGGIAVGVHTTQFAIRRVGLYHPVLQLAIETAQASLRTDPRPFATIAGVIGETSQAVSEASIAQSLGYDAVLLSLGGLDDLDERALIAHCRSVADVMPIVGFYLQPAVGGRVLSYRFWRDLAELPQLIAVKIAPFDRYKTIDVVRAIVSAGRDDVALYTGNDDAIVADLTTPFPVRRHGVAATTRVVGGLLGQWAVWTRRAVELLARIRAGGDSPVAPSLLTEGAELTDANGAIFDAANRFAGCIPGIHEVLRRQGLLRGIWTLDPRETLSPRQADELDRVMSSYPWLTDDAFVAEHRERWLTP